MLGVCYRPLYVETRPHDTVQRAPREKWRKKRFTLASYAGSEKISWRCPNRDVPVHEQVVESAFGVPGFGRRSRIPGTETCHWPARAMRTHMVSIAAQTVDVNFRVSRPPLRGGVFDRWCVQLCYPRFSLLDVLLLCGVSFIYVVTCWHRDCVSRGIAKGSVMPPCVCMVCCDVGLLWVRHAAYVTLLGP